MPAMLEDPAAPAIYRVSGAPPYPTSDDPQIPPTIMPHQVTLRDRITKATLIPFSHPSAVPPSLLSYLCRQLNLEIEKGDTYPMTQPMLSPNFGAYWFQNFGAVMLLGEISSTGEVAHMENSGASWEKLCLGSFYIKPNYPGRSSHICNGGFLVTDAARGRGVGRLMGEEYLAWAPKLGYTYSVFNLVYETNVASCRIWDALGFKRIGRVKDCGNLRSHPGDLVAAVIYGRDLGPEGEDYVSEERFEKIKFYLKHGKYPNGSDRAEKSRLRSAATHYKLLPAENDDEGDGSERLMLKDKEVVIAPQRQYEIARQIHVSQHGGINKTTATIADKYHWVRIKETVSQVIKNCPDCKETAAKVPVVRPIDGEGSFSAGTNGGIRNGAANSSYAPIERLVNFDDLEAVTADSRAGHMPNIHTLGMNHTAPIANMRALQAYTDMPLDPQIMGPLHQQHQQGNDQEFNGMQQVAQYTRRSGAQEAPCDIDMPLGKDSHPKRHADTRMATDRHVRMGDDPMAFQDGGGFTHDASGAQDGMVDLDAQDFGGAEQGH